MTFAAAALADLDAFFADFRDTSVVTHGGVPATVYGTFENEYADLDLDAGTVQSANKAFYCKTSDVPSAAQGDTHSITSTLHNITTQAFSTVKVQVSPPDLGPGITRFVLRKA